MFFVDACCYMFPILGNIISFFNPFFSWNKDKRRWTTLFLFYLIIIIIIVLMPVCLFVPSNGRGRFICLFITLFLGLVVGIIFVIFWHNSIFDCFFKAKGANEEEVTDNDIV